MFAQKARQNEAHSKTVYLTETAGSAAGGVEFDAVNLKTSATVGTSPFGRTRSGRRPTCRRTWSFFFISRQVLNINGRPNLFIRLPIRQSVLLPAYPLPSLAACCLHARMLTNPSIPRSPGPSTIKNLQSYSENYFAFCYDRNQRLK
jgi:hypothetical protein